MRCHGDATVCQNIFGQTLTLSERKRQTRVGDADFCQITVEWVMRSLAKLQLR